jgi:hypothetical protein
LRDVDAVLVYADERLVEVRAYSTRGKTLGSSPSDTPTRTAPVQDPSRGDPAAPPETVLDDLASEADPRVLAHFATVERDPFLRLKALELLRQRRSDEPHVIRLLEDLAAHEQQPLVRGTAANLLADIEADVAARTEPNLPIRGRRGEAARSARPRGNR